MVNIKVAGNIINEISAIPKGTLALVELIKNAYEANAKAVTIKLDRDRIEISDDGEGMKTDEIDSLLNISMSKKVYGEKIKGTNRLVSGEKGLGFFSVFKFGRKVSVETIKDNKKALFTLDLTDIEEKNDISTVEVPVRVVKENRESGTRISITNLNNDFYTTFKDELSQNLSKASRLCHSIDDDSFKISLYVDGENKGNEEISPDSTFLKFKIANSYFDSSSNKIIVQKYSGSNKENNFEQFEMTNELLKNSNFILDVNIDFFKFSGGGGIKQAPNAYIHGNRLSPLIYINNVLFDVDSKLYDPEINMSQRNIYVFKQQIGKIKIFLRSPDILKFNSDRTALVENKNFKDLKQLLDDISEKSQRAIYNLQNPGKEIPITKKRQNSEKERNTDISKEENKKPAISSSTQRKQKKKLDSISGKQKQKHANDDFLKVPGYNGEANKYPFLELTEVGDLFKEFNHYDVKKAPLISLMIIRPVYEASINLIRRKNMLKDLEVKPKLDEAVKQVTDYILKKNKLLTKICKIEKTISYNTLKNVLGSVNYYKDVAESNVFLHHMGEDLKSISNIRELLQHVYTFAVIVDRWAQVAE